MLLAACGRVDFDPLAPADAPLLAGPDAHVPDRVLFLPFNNTYDDVGTNRVGVCDPTCPTFAPGHAATGVKFDGTACLRYDDVAAYDTPTFTVAAWVDVNAFKRGTFVSKPYNGETTIENSFQLWADDGNNLQFVTYVNGAAMNDAMITPKGAAQPWQFVAATFDGMTKRIYVDGVEKLNGVGPAPVAFDNGAIRVGCDLDNGVVNGQVSGTLDDIYIYSRALSAAEIATLAAM